MENQRLLYLVQHSNKEMFKIGIGTDKGRFRDLDRDYSIDWESSLYFQGENQDITKMERILHKLFYEYRLDKQNGTGGTEWFSTNCLEPTVEAILFNVGNSGYSIDLQPKEIILNECNVENEKLSITENNIKRVLSYNKQKQNIFKKYPKTIIDKWIQLDNLESSQKVVEEMNRLIPEFHCFLKPSELCQVVCTTKNKNFNGSLTATQVDIMNLLLYKSREDIVKNKIKEISSFFEIDIELNYFNTVLQLNNNNVYAPIINQLDELSYQRVKINALGKNKEMETTLTRFIHKIKYSKHKNINRKIVKLTLDGEIISMLIDTKKLFSKMFLKIQFSMVSKYSKILYEVLKDYANINQIVIDFELIIALLNVDISKQSLIQWSSFRPNILERAISEINEKSDIQVSYEPIKEKLEGKRLQVTKIKFFIKKQNKQQLIKLGLIEESITSLPFYNKSKSKLDKLVKNGYKVVDEEMWIQTDIKKNEKQYDSEIRIDTWLKETNQDDKNKIYEIMADSLNDCDDPMVIIEDYRIVGLFTKEGFTKNATETMNLMNQVIDSLNEYTL